MIGRRRMAMMTLTMMMRRTIMLMMMVVVTILRLGCHQFRTHIPSAHFQDAINIDKSWWWQWRWWWYWSWWRWWCYWSWWWSWWWYWWWWWCWWKHWSQSQWWVSTLVATSGGENIIHRGFVKCNSSEMEMVICAQVKTQMLPIFTRSANSFHLSGLIMP